MPGLRETAEADLAGILEDPLGFGWPIVLTDPNTNVRSFTGFSNDIAQVIDPETGVAVNGRRISVALRTSSIIASGLSLPRGVPRENTRPWVVSFADLAGKVSKFKVVESDPDRTLGVVILHLELYEG